MRVRKLSLGLLLLTGANARAEGLLACATTSVVAFGASVTQATFAMVPPYAGFVADAEKWGEAYGPQGEAKGFPVPKRPRPFGLSPVRYIVKALGGTAAVRNVTYRSVDLTQTVSDLGSSQIQRLLHGVDRPLFDEATMLIGVDAFYWDAIFGYCNYGNPGYPGRAEASALELIRAARGAGKILVLGTVPIENEKNIRMSTRRTGIPNMWRPAQPACVARINRVIREECRREHACYIADLAAAADALDWGEQLSLVSDGGRAYGLYDMRPDGVHMSDKGTRYISQLVLTEMGRRMPSCPVTAAKAEPEPAYEGPAVSEFR